MTLLTKIYDDSQLGQVERSLKSLLESLRVNAYVCGVEPRGWVRVSISGEDENVGVRYLADRIGLCPAGLEEVEKFSTFRGYVTDSLRSKSELRVDIGVSSPSRVDAVVPLRRLQAQLGDGRRIALGKLAELFGLCGRLPLDVRILSVDLERTYIEAELSERQQERYAEWSRSLLDRLLILGTSDGEVRSAVRRAGLNRDVIDVESLGIFEHAAVCKLGTDAAGLIPKLGRSLRRATFSVFNPRRILALLGADSPLFTS